MTDPVRTLIETRVYIAAAAFDQDGGDSIVHNLPSGHRPRSSLSLNVHNFEEWP